mgnify:FL=1
MKPVRFAAIAVALFTISSTSFAATEISKNESSGLKNLGNINVIQNMEDIHENDISRKADAAGADYYVINTAGSIGNGSNSIISATIFAKNK